MPHPLYLKKYQGSASQDQISGEKVKPASLLALAAVFALFTVSFGYFSGQTITTDRLDLGKMLMVSLAGVIVILLLMRQRITFAFTYRAFLIILLGWMFAICFFRSDISISLKNFLNILLTQILLILVANIFWKFTMEKLLNLLIVLLQGLLFLCLYVQITRVGPLEFANHNPDARFGGLFFYGETGVAAGLGAVLSSLQYFNPFTKGKRILYIASFFLFCFYCAATDMRTVFVAIGAAFIVQFCVKRMSSRKSVFLPLLLAALFVLAFKAYSSFTAADSSLEQDLGGRETIWSVSNKMIRDRPLTGYGNYGNELNRISNSMPGFYASFFESELGDPHSAFRSLALQSGLVAFFIFLLFVGKSAIRMLKTKGYAKAAISLLLYWLICGSTGGTYFDFTYTLGGVLFELTLLGLLLHPRVLTGKEKEELPA